MARSGGRASGAEGGAWSAGAVHVRVDEEVHADADVDEDVHVLVSYRPRFVGGALLAATMMLLARAPVAAQPAPSGSSRGLTRVEGVAALVGGSAPGAGTVVILRSDVSLRARIALAGHATRLPVGPLPEPLLRATLDELIGEVLIAREADRLRAARPSDEDIRRERQRLDVEAGSAERLRALTTRMGADEEELRAIAERRAYVQAFLRANLEGSTVISDAQVQRIYESGEHPFANQPLDDVREMLRGWIAQEVLQRDVRRWVEVLRSRTPVRVVAPWRGEGDATEDGDADDGG